MKANLGGHAGGFTPGTVAGPLFGQVQSPCHRRGDLPVADHYFHTNLAVGLFAHCAAVLMGHPHRFVPLLKPAGLVNYPGAQRFHHRHHFPANGLPDLLLRPRTVGNELLQFLTVGSQPLSHRLNRLTLSRQKQTLHVKGRSYTPFASPQSANQRFEKFRKLVDATLPKLFIPRHASTQ